MSYDNFGAGGFAGDTFREYKQDQTPTEVEVIYPCWIHGVQRKVGEIVTVGKQDAIYLCAMKRAELVER